MTVATKGSRVLTEYEAAKTVGMSPTLLRWLTSYAPRPDSERKLQIAKKEQDTLFFDETELLDFNAWLARPWPKKDDEARPGVPAGIRNEIRIEANGECAICLANADNARRRTSNPSRSRATTILRIFFGFAAIIIRRLISIFSMRRSRNRNSSELQRGFFSLSGDHNGATNML